jgi:hypothetical protein
MVVTQDNMLLAIVKFDRVRSQKTGAGSSEIHPAVSDFGPRTSDFGLPTT